MKRVTVDVPEELLALLATTRLADRPPEQQVRIALARFLFEHEVISFGKATELADEPRFEFQLLAAELGVAVVRYDVEDYEQDLRGWAAAERQAQERARTQ